MVVEAGTIGAGVALGTERDDAAGDVEKLAGVFGAIEGTEDG